MKGRVAVNLLPWRQKWYERRRAFWLKLQGVSMGVALVYGLVVLGIISWRLILGSKATATKQQVEATKQEIDSLAATESQWVLVKSKLQRMNQVDQARVDFSGLVKELWQLVPAAIELGEMKVKSASEVTLTGRTSSVVALAQLVAVLGDADQGGNFLETVKLDSVTKGSSGEYTIALTLVPKVKQK